MAKDIHKTTVATDSNRKNSTTKSKLPARELRTWLKKHRSWNHADWLDLLAELRKKNCSILTDSPEGRDSIGRFLEKNREK